MVFCHSRVRVGEDGKEEEEEEGWAEERETKMCKITLDGAERDQTVKSRKYIGA